MDGWWAASYLVLWLVVAALAVVVVALARQVGTLHLRLGPRGALEIEDEGPPLGQAPPAISASDLTGEHVTIGGPGEAQVLLFVSPGCRVCEEVLPSVGAMARERDVAPYVVTDVDWEESALAYSDRSIGARIIPSVDAVTTYEVPGTPYAVVLDARGIVRAKGTINNLEQMEGLIDTARKRIEAARAEQST